MDTPSVKLFGPAICVLFFAIGCSHAGTRTPASNPGDVVVSRKLQSENVRLNQLQMTLAGQNVAKNSDGSVSPMGSSAEFFLKGTYETRNCFIDELLARAEGDESSDLTHEIYRLELIGIERTNGVEVELFDGACAGGSAGSFSLPFNIRIQMWGNGDKLKTWTYMIRQGAGSGTDKRLIITFSVDSGWSATFQ